MTLSDSPKSGVAVCITTVSDLIGKWPCLADFAEDLAVPYDTAKGMRRRGAIDARHWVTIVESACRRGIAGVSYELLATLHAR